MGKGSARRCDGLRYGGLSPLDDALCPGRPPSDETLPDDGTDILREVAAVDSHSLDNASRRLCLGDLCGFCELR